MVEVNIDELEVQSNILRLYYCLPCSEPWGERGTRNVDPSRMVCYHVSPCLLI